MKTIGITGGVGSGKTAVLDYFRQHYQARILVADEAAHLLEEPGKACYNKLVTVFGTAILSEDREGASIDKKKMADIIFRTRDALQKVNEIIHPEVKKYILSEIEHEKKESRRLMVVEAALLIECGYQDILDEIWYVYASAETRKRRLKESRGYSDEKIERIMSSQLSEEQYRMNAKRIIDNDGSLERAKSQIDSYLQEK